MIAFPEFSNRLPWNSIEHITVFNSGSGKIRRRKTKREGEREVEGKSEKSRSFGWKLIKIFLNRELCQNLCFFIKTWEFNFCYSYFICLIFVSCRKITIPKVENTNKWYIEESSTGEYLKHVDTNNRHEKFRLKTNYFFHDLRIFIIYT